MKKQKGKERKIEKMLLNTFWTHVVCKTHLQTNKKHDISTGICAIAETWISPCGFRDGNNLFLFVC